MIISSKINEMLVIAAMLEITAMGLIVAGIIAAPLAIAMKLVLGTDLFYIMGSVVQKKLSKNREV